MIVREKLSDDEDEQMADDGPKVYEQELARELITSNVGAIG